MALVARGDGVDVVTAVHGAPSPSGGCGEPLTTSTDICSTDVFVDGVGAVHNNCAMTSHPYPAPSCPDHAPLMDSGSGTVFVNGQGIARSGDSFTTGHPITSVTQGTVYAG